MTREEFWMVWSPQGGAPTVKHDEERLALSEAERLARKCPGHEFYVLRAEHLRCVDSMVRERLGPAPMPF